MTLRIRQRCNACVGFDEKLSAIAEDDGEKSVLVGCSKSGFESEFISIEGNALVDVAHYEEGRDCRRCCACHERSLFMWWLNIASAGQKVRRFPTKRK